jgi:hypothetical protein
MNVIWAERAWDATPVEAPELPIGGSAQGKGTAVGGQRLSFPATSELGATSQKKRRWRRSFDICLIYPQHRIVDFDGKKAQTCATADNSNFLIGTPELKQGEPFLQAQ